jgi:1,4-alpha-glucan branching enzyme
MDARSVQQTTSAAEQLWYKDAIIYQLHVKSFFDSNDDGIGDFPGLISRLDYIADLGVNAIWLLPFYPSPRLDDGYDISAYRDVHPDYGSLADFRHFVRAAHSRGIRVITEMVINHTSDQHRCSSVPATPSRERPGGISMSGPTPIRNTPVRASSSSTSSARTGPGTPWPAPITGTGSIRISPI